MMAMGMFSKKSDADKETAAVIKEFRKTAVGSPLSRDGACSFFYNTFTYAGETIPLQSGKDFAFFHVEHDDILQEILDGTPAVGIEAGSERVFLSIIFKTGNALNRIYLTFDLSRGDSLRILRSILGRKSIEINLLNMVYGGIVKEKTLVISIPDTLLVEIKKAAG
jgi:hypothetical protein